MAKSKGGGRALGSFAFLLFFVLFFTGLAPFDFEFPLQDMEGSWELASAYAGAHHFAYGTQFVFTNGPLFPLYHREYAWDASAWYSLARLALAAYLGWGFARLSRAPGPAAWPVVALGFLLLWVTISYQTNDSILLLIPLLATLLCLADRGPHLELIVGVTAAAAVSLGKVSFIPFCIGAFVLADMALLHRRRLPLALLTYVLAGWVLFVVAGQRPADFVPFLVGSFDMTQGYSAALAKDGPALEFYAYLVVWAIVGLGLILRQRIAIRAGEEGRPIALLRLLLIAGFFVMSLKAGFVRHDTHSYAAWGMLLFTVVLLGLPGLLRSWRPAFSWTCYALPSLLTVALLGYLAATDRSVPAPLTQTLRILGAQLGEAFVLATDLSAWRAAEAQAAETSYRDIRAAQPLPPLSGTVDAIANTQASIIAAGLDFAPRPTLQENMTFSPALIARNAAYLSGPTAPDHLLFAPGATDGRHPASVEGSLWPLLLARYAVASEASGQLILDKRQAPAPLTLTPAGTISTGFAEDIPLPQGRPLFLKLGIRETWLGHLVDTAFKPPLVYIVERYADGRTETYRLIPGMIAEGMVISPTIRTPADYRRLASGNIAGLDAPTSVRIETAGPWAYDPTISGSLATLAVPVP